MLHCIASHELRGSAAGGAMMHLNSNQTKQLKKKCTARRCTVQALHCTKVALGEAHIILQDAMPRNKRRLHSRRPHTTRGDIGMQETTSHWGRFFLRFRQLL